MALLVLLIAVSLLGRPSGSLLSKRVPNVFELVLNMPEEEVVALPAPYHHPPQVEQPLYPAIGMIAPLPVDVPQTALDNLPDSKKDDEEAAEKILQELENYRAGEWEGKDGCGLVLVGSSTCHSPHCCSCTVTKNDSCSQENKVKEEWNVKGEAEFIEKFSESLSNSIQIDSPLHCNFLKDRLKGVTRQRILADVNRLRCIKPDQAKPPEGKQPNLNKYEMFFLAKYLLKSRLCTIEIKVLKNGVLCSLPHTITRKVVTRT